MMLESGACYSVEGFCARARQGYWSLLCFSAFEIKMMLEKEFGKISSL